MTLAERLPQAIDDLDHAKAELDAHGYCVIPNVLSRAEVAALKARLVEQAEGERARGVAFQDGGPGRPNQRVWMLLNKGKVFRDLMLRPIVDALMSHLLGADFLVSSFTANIAHPGGVVGQHEFGTSMCASSQSISGSKPKKA